MSSSNNAAAQTYTATNNIIIGLKTLTELCLLKNGGTAALAMSTAALK
jgi:hypothetical protein